jgi:galactokinase
MVESAQSLMGCYGARLTGAGFGGCTVNLVASAHAQNFTRALAARYAHAVGHTPEIYVCRASAGAGVIPI